MRAIGLVTAEGINRMDQLPDFLANPLNTRNLSTPLILVQYVYENKKFTFRLDLSAFNGRNRLINILRWTSSNNVPVSITYDFN